MTPWVSDNDRAVTFGIVCNLTLCCFGLCFSHPVPARTLSASQSLLAKKPVVDDDEETNQPIKFTTSKASHRSWSVDRSLGSTYQRPWWRVLPFSVVGVGFVVWCFWRSETEVDQILEKELYDHIPGLLANEEEEEEEAGQTRWWTGKMTFLRSFYHWYDDKYLFFFWWKLNGCIALISTSVYEGGDGRPSVSTAAMNWWQNESEACVMQDYNCMYVFDSHNIVSLMRPEAGSLQRFHFHGRLLMYICHG